MRMIAHCGLVCSECPTWEATRTDDDELRRRTAAEWSVMYGSEISPSDIDCAGCTSAEGPHFHHCRECGVRACGIEKGLDNCGLCEEYPSCAIISGFLSMVPGAAGVLEEVRRSRSL